MDLKFLILLFFIDNLVAETNPSTKITFVSVDDNLPPKGSVKFSSQIETQAKVVPLIEGIMYPTERGYFMTGSVTFIEDQGYYMVVDSPSASDQVAKDQLFKELNALGVLPSQIFFAFTTHGHPDHFGQGNFFSNAKHFFGPYEYSGSTFTRTQLFNKNEIRLTTNVEIWNTPGHTNQDISIVVRNVQNYGTVAVVGDLFYSEIDALSDSKDWQKDALDGRLGMENRRRVLCAADAIVPGHSKIFRVSPEMRAKSGCSTPTLSIASNEITSFRSEPVKQREQQIPETIQPTLMTLPLSLQQRPNISTPPQPRIYSTETLTNPTIPTIPNEPQQSTAPVSLAVQPQTQQLYPLTSQPLLSADTIQNLQRTVLLPFLESTATNLANYLTAAQGGIPVPLAGPQIRTAYPAFYPTQLQMLPQKRMNRQ